MLEKRPIRPPKLQIARRKLTRACEIHLKVLERPRKALKD
jgi:hypothetical protein